MSKKKRSSRRRRAGKSKAKAAPKRRRRRAGKAKAAPKRRRRRNAGKAKAAPKRRRRRARRNAKGMRRSASSAARAMGLIKHKRRNPGGVLDFLKAEAKDMMAIAPSVAVQLGAMAAVGYASSMATAQIRKRATGALAQYAGVISSSAITFAAFAALKMMKSEKIKQFAMPVFFGGIAATAVQALAAIKVKKDAAEISLGQHLGLPIGEYMALSGFVDVHGRPLAVDGYVAESLGAMHLSQGPHHEGTVVSMGDYTAESLGALSLREGPYHEGTVLGEIGQMSEGRQGARALNSPGDPRVEDFIHAGSLSGSVFD